MKQQKDTRIKLHEETRNALRAYAKERGLGDGYTLNAAIRLLWKDYVFLKGEVIRLAQELEQGS